MVTIGDSESVLKQSLPDVLREILPQTELYTLEVEILENGRKKRRDASRESWRPESGEILIKFGEATAAAAPPDGSSGGSQIDGLLRALQAAERRPGFEFVALKWFRDMFLPAQDFAWAKSPSARDEILRRAIEGGLVLTSKVPNPKSPAFPVTAIRLNRQHPAVIAAVGDDVAGDRDFQPLTIRGEALSSTILRERR